MLKKSKKKKIVLYTLIAIEVIAMKNGNDYSDYDINMVVYLNFFSQMMYDRRFVLIYYYQILTIHQ